MDIAGELGLHLGDFAAQVLDDSFAVNRIDEHADGERVGEVDEGREPVGVDEAGVACDKEGAVVGVVDLDVTEVDFDGFGGDDVPDIAGSHGKLGKCRGNARF